LPNEQREKILGRDFILTTSKEQAESLLRTSIAKAIATGTIEIRLPQSHWL
jgi:hypothetical protein